MKPGTLESLLSSYAAATFSTLFCTYEQHFQVIWSDPSTYTAPLHHKCGCTMILCLAWSTIETILFAANHLRERRDDRAYAAKIALRRTKPEAATYRYAPAR